MTIVSDIGISVMASGSSALDGSPSLLTATVDSDTAITLNWTIGSTNHDGHRIYISTDNVTFVEKGTVTGATATYQATGLTAGTLYYFYVVAYKGSTESTASNIYDTYFKITIDTTKAGSANDTFVLPTIGSGTANYYITWGDGSAEEHVTVATSQTHVYSTPGTYQIKIRGVFPSIYFANAGDRLKLMSIDNWGNTAWKSVNAGFSGCENMVGTFTDVPNLTAVTSIKQMFLLNKKFNSAIVNWNIPNVTSTNSFLSGCSIFNSQVTFINADKVADASAMLGTMPAYNQPTSFNFPVMTNCERMFSGNTIFNSSVSLTTGLVTNMKYMFADSYAFKQLLDFNIESLTDATGMFSNVTLPVDVYEDMLEDWASQNVKDSVPFHGGNAYLLYGSAGLTARTHLVSVHSWVITDGGHTFDNGKIVFTFDDNFDSQYTAVPGVLSSESISGTFYICTDHVGTTGYMTWENLQTLNAAGYDIQCHTKTHTNFNSLTNQQVLDELIAVEGAFSTNSLPTPLHTAYPQGNCSAAQALVVATKRLSARGIAEKLFTSGVVCKYSLGSYSIDPLSVPGGLAVAKAKSVIDSAKANNKAATFYCHAFNSAGYLSTSQFTEIVQYAKSVGVDILTISGLYALMD